VPLVSLDVDGHRGCMSVLRDGPQGDAQATVTPRGRALLGVTFSTELSPLGSFFGSFRGLNRVKRGQKRPILQAAKEQENPVFHGVS
jgi:hypothetical protein